MRHLERKEIIFIAAVCLVGFGGLYLFGKFHHSDNLYGMNQKVTVSNKRSMEREMVRGFETSLNHFIQTVFRRVQDYRKQRRILDELIFPGNLRNAAYIEGNYQTAREAIPVLKAQADGIINVFAQKDREIKSLVKGRSAMAQQIILRQWKKTKDEQGGKFVSYFSVENEVLDAYEALIRFYYTKQHAVRFDAQNELIYFDSVEDTQQEKTLRGRIAALKKKQSEALK